MAVQYSFSFADYLQAFAVMSSGLAITSAFLTVLTMSTAFQTRWKDHHEGLQIISTLVLSLLIALPFAAMLPAFFFTLILGMLCFGFSKILPNISVSGVCILVQSPLLILSGLMWYANFLSRSSLLGTHFSPVFLLPPIICAEALLAYFLGIGTYSLLIRKIWTQPYNAYQCKNPVNNLFVSVHVPCHAEPPALVIETLEALARLDYKNYEVIVCDNNTSDPALWKPVEIRCRQLNTLLKAECFRFFHIENMAGAKAGALNFCLDKVDARTTLIAVVDADYIAETDFLSTITPWFGDPELVFVQTSHDYHHKHSSYYHQLCHWEYMVASKYLLVGTNELDSAYTIGTMCLFRLAAVKEAGGWAEWCLTEDSEIAVRLRAGGGKGRFFSDTFGRGTIPESFGSLKQQRFRWTAGPVQQLFAHWRLFLPVCLGGTASLSSWSKTMEVLRSLQMFFGIILLVFVIAVSFTALLDPPTSHNIEDPALPVTGLFIFFSFSINALVLIAMGYRMTGCPSPLLIFMSYWIGRALTFTCMLATIAAFTTITLKWKRTPKFFAQSSFLQALANILPELFLAFLLIALFITTLLHSKETGLFSTLIVCGVLLRFILSFIAAPFVALLGYVGAKK